MKKTAMDCAREHGLSVSEVSRITGVNRATLYRWYEDKPALFAVVLLGCRALKAADTTQQEK